eukprot:gene5439-5987_t
MYDDKGFDWTLGNTSVRLSAVTYCPVESYLNRSYQGYLHDFQPVYPIFSKAFDVQGLIGFIPSQKMIYIAFRGTTSLIDWLNDFDTILVPYPPCQGCEVHQGFYLAEQDVFPIVLCQVRSLLREHSDYDVMVTGHSLGAALATLTALDLIQSKLPNTLVRLMTFGSPRVGSLSFAQYASSIIENRVRVTFHRDVVPHVPWQEFYEHISGEWYQANSSSIKACHGFEDESCSDQWYVLSLDDHMTYLGIYLSCETVVSSSLPGYNNKKQHD